MSGIYQFPPAHQVSHILQRRIQKHLVQKSDDEIFSYLADTLYTERRRLEEFPDPSTPPIYLKTLQSAARAIRRDTNAMRSALLKLVDVYTHEIHNNFSPRTYQFASKVLPGALSRLLTTAQPTQLLGIDFDPGSKIRVSGPIQKLQSLSKKYTFIYTPTHLSNLDSPLIGYALAEISLPPVIYGAGLNLFSNSFMSFFMSRLGAYTVDRRKKNQLYKDVLKEYSINAIRNQCHSLFFPGGTRSRSGQIERKLKKGLMGTAVTAWQESLSEREPLEVLFVPCTLSFSLTLEAETLIQDSLADEGESRYIITDDEFSEARTVATFAKNILNLDSSVYIRFGDPLDIVGNPVDEQGISIDPNGRTIDRREYVTDRFGQVRIDTQRDQVYTSLLSQKITQAYRRDNIALSTHVAARAAWDLLSYRYPRLDNVQKAMLQNEERRILRTELLSGIDRLLKQIHRASKENRICDDLSRNPADILHDALRRFGSFHKTRVLAARGEQVEVGSKLALYYGNRLEGYGFNTMGL